MAIKTDSQLSTSAVQVRDETGPGANTAARVGNLFQDFIDSKVNVNNPKQYVALMSQTGTSNPTVKVLRNDLSAAIVWTRGSAGVYVGTLSGAFTVDKTFFPPDCFQQYTGTDFQNIAYTRISANVIHVETTIGANGAGVSLDGVIVTDFPIKVEVYN